MGCSEAAAFWLPVAASLWPIENLFPQARKGARDMPTDAVDVPRVKAWGELAGEPRSRRTLALAFVQVIAESQPLFGVTSPYTMTAGHANAINPSGDANANSAYAVQMIPSKMADAWRE